MLWIRKLCLLFQGMLWINCSQSLIFLCASIAQCKQCASMQQPAKTPLCFQTPEFSRQASVPRLQAWVPGLLQASVPGFFQPSVDCGTICTSSSRCLFFFQGDATITASIGNTLSNPAASFAKPPCLSSPLHDQSI